MADRPACPTPLRILEPRTLDEIRRSTLGHYEESAQGFWEGTRGHDVQQNLDALLAHVEGDAPLSILDLGCGPGRDLVAFQHRGHAPVGLDGAAAFVEMARRHAGCEVLHQDLLALDLGTARFDGVFANASLFHVPTQELPRVLVELHAALKPRGVLFASNPRSFDSDVEGFQGARYGAYLREDSWRAYCRGAGFTEIESYYRPPGRPRQQQPWFASVWRRG